MSAILDRAIAMLERLSLAPQGLALADICRSCGVAKGTAHRLLAHLIKRGYVRQSDEDALYTLTLQLPLLSARFLERQGFLDICQPQLDRLAELSGELVRLAWLDGNRLVFIAEAQRAAPGLRYDANLGQVATLHVTAVGRVWLATMAPEQVVQCVRDQGRLLDPKLGPSAIKSERELLTEVTRTRRRGYALAIDEGEVGAAAVAVPIAAPLAAAGFVGALAIIGPTARLQRARLVAFVPAMRAAADTIAQLWPLRSFCRKGGAASAQTAPH
jgi:IclR family acetate operon transcriptional repressor